MNIIEALLKDSAYRLDQFKPEHIATLEKGITLKETGKAVAPYFSCLVRGKPIKLTPEAAVAEIRAWEAPPVFANTRDRSLLGSLNRFKDEAWMHFAHNNRSLPEAAAGQWEGFFRHPSFALPGRRYGDHDWQRPLALVRARLQATSAASGPERGHAPSGCSTVSA